jgi:hypothetical protein
MAQNETPIRSRRIGVFEISKQKHGWLKTKRRFVRGESAISGTWIEVRRDY